MIKTCENPTCKREFRAGGQKKRFCTPGCRNEYHLDRLRSKKFYNDGGKAIEQQVVELLEWKAKYIKAFHLSEPVEQLSLAIKKSQAVVVEYCEQNGLSWFTRIRKTLHTEGKKIEREPEEKTITRPPAVYCNQTKVFPYKIALL